MIFSEALLVLILAPGVSGTEPGQPDFPITIAATAGAAAPAGSELVLRFDGPLAGQLEVLRLVKLAGDTVWRLADHTQAVATDGVSSIRGTAGLNTLLIIRAGDHAGYLLAGPLRWPGKDGSLDVPLAWRRTVRGEWPAGDTGPPQWLSSTDDALPSAWPQCVPLTGGHWECLGVPLDASGVVFSSTPPRLLFGIARGMDAATVETVSPSSAEWGRLLVVGRADRVPVSRTDRVVVAARKLQVPRMRRLPSRAMSEADSRIDAERLAEGVYWVSGTASPEASWLEITALGRAPLRLDMPAVVQAFTDIPVHVHLEEAAAVAGRVIEEGGSVAPGVVVTLYRLIPDGRTDRARPPRRVTVDEVTTDGDGVFRFTDVAREPHELLAFHPASGRAERAVSPDDQDVQLRLRPPSRAIGRVIRQGLPAAGVRVASVPELTEFAAMEDVTELLGGDTTTDQDGRFIVSLAPRGSIGLRIGGERAGVRRLSLGAAESLPRTLDVGTIDLNPLPRLTLILPESAGCDLLLIGPIGRAGLTIHPAVRLGPAMFEARLPEPGNWSITVRCAGQPRALTPRSINVAGDEGERTIQLAWR